MAKIKQFFTKPKIHLLLTLKTYIVEKESVIYNKPGIGREEKGWCAGAYTQVPRSTIFEYETNLQHRY
jgi:hypothetical protein